VNSLFALVVRELDEMAGRVVLTAQARLAGGGPSARDGRPEVCGGVVWSKQQFG